MLEEIFSMLFDIFKIMFMELWLLFKSTVVYLWHHPRVLLLTLIVLFVTFFQFYRLSASGSQLSTDRSEIPAVQKIIAGYPFIPGPQADNGNYTMGPLYYHIAMPFVVASSGDPIGIIIMVEMFSIAIVYLLFHIGKNFFSKEAGLFAAALYAVSALFIDYARMSALPVLMLFFTLLLMLMTFNAIGNAKPIKYFILSGFFLGLCIQLNSFALVLGIIIFIYFFFAEWLMNGFIMWKTTFKHDAFFFLGAFIGLFSYLMADYPMRFANIAGMFAATFGTIPQTAQSLGSSYFAKLLQIFLQLFSQVIFNFPTPDKLSLLQTNQLILWELFISAFVLAAFYLLAVYRNRFIILLLGLWLIGGGLSFNLYNGTNAFHLTYLFPLSFLLIGNVLGFIYRSFTQDRYKMEQKKIGNSPDGEEMYELIRVDRTDKKKLFVHFLAITCSLSLFVVITVLNFFIKLS